MNMAFWTVDRAVPPVRASNAKTRQASVSVSVALTLLALVGCGAVYPEMKTAVRTPPSNYSPNPAPPEDVLYLSFASAYIPQKTRDGRNWDSVGGSAPDPFAKLVIEGKEIIVTPVQANTRKPTWPDQVRANYRIPRGTWITVELWDSNPINNHPICRSRLSNIHDQAGDLPIEVNCESGARLTLSVEPPRPLLGLGMYYELQGEGRVRITRVIAESPAGRAGLVAGTKIVSIQGRDASTLDDLEIKSLVNANTRTGLALGVVLPSGERKDVSIREEAMYPLVGESAETTRALHAGT